MCQCSTSTFEDSPCECTVLVDMPESRDVTEQINWRGKKQPSQVACVSEDLKWRSRTLRVRASTKPRTSHHRSPERTRKGHRRSDEHWKCFRGIMAKLSLREGVERIWVFHERVDIIVNWSEPKLAKASDRPNWSVVALKHDELIKHDDLITRWTDKKKSQTRMTASVLKEKTIPYFRNNRDLSG